ncbi:DMT family transporter [Corynebacterium glaucum]|uniref:DMT family transporter n=1 Tax=Corynebacterium glaucum TaxID=187491 RepID=UPI00265ADCB7|nr:DMT family transporter [Corynebacterium glaucum]
MKQILIAVAFVVCWSSGFVGSLLAGDSASPVGLLAWRYLVTSALLLGVVGLIRVTNAPIKARALPALGRTDVWQQVAIGVLSHAIFLGAVFSASAADIDPGITSLICALQPLLVAAVSSRLWNDPFNGRMFAGLGLGLAAVGLAVGSIDFAASAAVSLLLPFVALFALSATAVLERAWRPKASIVQALAIQTTTAAVLFVGVAVATGRIGVTVNAELVWAILWLVFLSGIGGYAAYTASLRTIGPTTTSVLLFLTPPVTSLWTWMMFGQEISLVQLAGMGLGLIAVALTVRGQRRATSQSTPKRHRACGFVGSRRVCVRYQFVQEHDNNRIWPCGAVG